MEGQVILAMVIAIPIVLLPAAFVWYLNIGGIHAALREAGKKRAARKEKEPVGTKI